MSDPIETVSTTVAPGAEAIPFATQLEADDAERAAKRAAAKRHAEAAQAVRDAIAVQREANLRADRALDAALRELHGHRTFEREAVEESARLLREADALDQEGVDAEAIRARAKALGQQAAKFHDLAHQAREEAQLARQAGASSHRRYVVIADAKVDVPASDGFNAPTPTRFRAGELLSDAHYRGTEGIAKLRAAGLRLELVSE